MSCCEHEHCHTEHKENRKLTTIFLFVRVALAILFCGLSFLPIFEKLSKILDRIK